MPDYPLLHDPAWLAVMRRHQELDASQFALRYSGRRDWPVREIAEQIHCYPRAASKLGALHRPGMIYLREPLEQASGYAAAVWRTRYGRGLCDADACGARDESGLHGLRRIADLTGGLGMDTAAFALAGMQVDYCERDAVLAAVARHNHRLIGLGSRVRWHTCDGMQWLASQRQSSLTESGKRDLIYIDPSRRSGGRRVHSLRDSEPDVTQYLPLIRSSAHRYLIKLSPMMEPVDVVRCLDDCTAVTAVSVNGELKELLAEGKPVRNPDSALRRTKPVFRAVLLDTSGNECFRFSRAATAQGSVERTEAACSSDSPPPSVQSDSLLYEPDPALFKMRLVDEAARRYGLGRIHPEIGYLTGPDDAPGPFPGNVFRIRQMMPFKPRTLRRWLSDNGLTRVHIHQRGFPLSVDQLYGKLGCRMGEQAHLVATLSADGQKVLFVTDHIG